MTSLRNLNDMFASVTIFLICMSFSQGLYEVSDYNARSKIIEELNAIYENFLLTDVYDLDSRSTQMTIFKQLFDEKFNNSDVWIYDAFTNGNLMNDYIITAKFDTSKVMEFLKNATSTIKTAIASNFVYHSQILPDRQKAEDVIQFQKRVDNDFHILEENTMKYLKNGWKSSLQQDVLTALSKPETNVTTLQNMLSTKYTNGEWLVLQYKTGQLKLECPANTFRINEIDDTTNLTTSIIMTSLQSSTVDNEVNHYFAKIVQYYKQLKKVDGMYKCWSRTLSIISGYDCNRNEYSFFGIFDKSGKLDIASTNEKLYQTQEFYHDRWGERNCEGIALVFGTHKNLSIY